MPRDQESLSNEARYLTLPGAVLDPFAATALLHLNALLAAPGALLSLRHLVFRLSFSFVDTVICGYSDTFLTGLNCSRT